MMDRNIKRIYYFPLKASMVFILLSELLVFIGPFDFNIQYPYTLVIYLAVVNVAFMWGYQLGVRKFRPRQFYIKIDFINIIIIIGLLLTIIRLIQVWASHGITFSFNHLIQSLINPADAYFSESIETAQTDFVTLLLSPITWACLPLGIYYWDKITKLSRFLVVLIILVQMMTWLGIGTRKGLFDIIIIIAFVFLARHNDYVDDSKKRKRFFRVVLVSSILFVFYFVFSNLSRYGLTFNEISDFNIDKTIRPFYINYCPMWLLVSLANITGYLCQGYYALSVGLSIGIIPPTFLGMSWFTMVIANKMGLDPMPHTYLSLLERYGIDSHVNWHTIYIWLANDFTFIGVPLVILIIGYAFANTWCECVEGKNAVAIPTFSLFLIMVFYFYANNQVLSFSFIPFVVWCLLYVLSRSLRV